MKLLLNNTQRLSILEGCLLETFKIPASHAMTKVMLDEAARYSQRTQELGKGHKLGAPSKYVWRALCRWILKETKDPDPPHLPVKNYLEQWEAHAKGQNPTFSIQMRHCKVVKAYDKEWTKLILCVHLGPLADVVRASVSQTGSTAFEGCAPAGAMERQIQKSLK